MLESKLTLTVVRTLNKWERRVTQAIEERDTGGLAALAWAIDATSPAFVGAAQMRAQALKARAEAGARFIGGRRHA